MSNLRTYRLFTFVSERVRKESGAGKLSLTKMACTVFVFCMATAILSPAQTFTTVTNFDGSNGLGPSSLVEGNDGSFYGTMQNGGANNKGTVVKITAGGTVTTLHSFDGTDGANPSGGLLQGTDGNFYGITSFGGAGGGAGSACTGGFCGTVFKITPAVNHMSPATRDEFNIKEPCDLSFDGLRSLLDELMDSSLLTCGRDTAMP
jgi:uncharacterized repeat protein (TIGR03803 family)